MAIVSTGDFPINPATTTGTDLADRLNRQFNAIVSANLNATRPSYLTAGAVWSQSVSGGGFNLYFYDGTTDLLIGTVDAAGVGSFGSAQPLAPVFSASMAYPKGAVIYDKATFSYLEAKNNNGPGAYNAGDWQTITNFARTAQQPAGAISQFAGSTAPSGWLLCNGSAVSRSIYADLFTAIGTTYGAGNGTTTFNVPNLGDKVAIGVGGTKTLGGTGGAASVTPTGSVQSTTLTTTQMPSHNHTLKFGAFGAGGSIQSTYNNTGTDTATTNTGGSSSHTHGLTLNAVNVEQPYLVLNYIIKV